VSAALSSFFDSQVPLNDISKDHRYYVFLFNFKCDSQQANYGLWLRFQNKKHQKKYM